MSHCVGCWQAGFSAVPAVFLVSLYDGKFECFEKKMP